MKEKLAKLWKKAKMHTLAIIALLCIIVVSYLQGTICLTLFVSVLHILFVGVYIRLLCGCEGAKKIYKDFLKYFVSEDDLSAGQIYSFTYILLFIAVCLLKIIFDDMQCLEHIIDTLFNVLVISPAIMQLSKLNVSFAQEQDNKSPNQESAKPD